MVHVPHRQNGSFHPDQQCLPRYEITFQEKKDTHKQSSEWNFSTRQLKMCVFTFGKQRWESWPPSSQRLDLISSHGRNSPSLCGLSLDSRMVLRNNYLTLLGVADRTWKTERLAWLVTLIARAVIDGHGYTSKGRYSRTRTEGGTRRFTGLHSHC